MALTYSSTNVSLYVDGLLATNDPGGLSVWPGSDAAPTVYFGSDLFGNYQANGMFNTVQTYDFVLDSNTVEQTYNSQVYSYELNPANAGAMSFGSAPSSPSTNSSTTNAITGLGFLTNGEYDASCSYNSTNAFYVWITNFVATPNSNGNMNVTGGVLI